MFTNATTTEISNFWSTLLIIDSSLRESSWVTVVKVVTIHLTSWNVALPPVVFADLWDFQWTLSKCCIIYLVWCQVRMTTMLLLQMCSVSHGQLLKNIAHHWSRNWKRILSFSVSVQHVKNTEMMVQCDECCMRIIYSKYKMKKEQRIKLQVVLNNFTYTCGSKLAERQLPAEFKYVEVQFYPICVYCGKDQPFTSNDVYPQCTDCIGKSPIHNK